MAANDAYYNSLFGPEAGSTLGAGASASGGSKLGRVGKGLSNPMLKSAGAGIFATWLLQKMMQTRHESGLQDIQLENLQSQAEMLTPQNLYYKAALPQAQEEESMARNALLSQLSGGVLGPQLAKGEFMIGG